MQQQCLVVRVEISNGAKTVTDEVSAKADSLNQKSARKASLSQLETLQPLKSLIKASEEDFSRDISIFDIISPGPVARHPGVPRLSTVQCDRCSLPSVKLLNHYARVALQNSKLTWLILAITVPRGICVRLKAGCCYARCVGEASGFCLDQGGLSMTRTRTLAATLGKRVRGYQ